MKVFFYLKRRSVLFVAVILINFNSYCQKNNDPYIAKKIEDYCRDCMSRQESVMEELLYKNLKIDSIDILLDYIYNPLDSSIISTTYFVNGEKKLVHFIQLTNHIILIPQPFPLADKKRLKFLKKFMIKNYSIKGRRLKKKKINWIMSYLVGGYKSGL